MFSIQKYCSRHTQSIRQSVRIVVRTYRTHCEISEYLPKITPWHPKLSVIFYFPELVPLCAVDRVPIRRPARKYNDLCTHWITLTYTDRNISYLITVLYSNCTQNVLNPTQAVPKPYQRSYSSRTKDRTPAILKAILKFILEQYSGRIRAVLQPYIHAIHKRYLNYIQAKLDRININTSTKSKINMWGNNILITKKR